MIRRRFKGVGKESVIGPIAEALTLNQTGLTKHLEVVANQGLGHAQFLSQVAHAELLAGQQLDDPVPQRLGQRPQAVPGCVRPAQSRIHCH